MKVSGLIVLLLVSVSASANSVQVTFSAADGTTVYGDVYRSGEVPLSAPLLLLFHQGGGDARGEYAPLAPRLLAAGYHLLAIDQRAGGTMLGGTNRTAEQFDANGKTIGYCDAYADIDAALDFAADYGFSGKTVAWGSSYSAALVFRLAAEHADRIDAVLAFSPASGDAMDGCRPETYSADVDVPLLALRPVSEMSVPYVPAQMALFEEHGHQVHVADPGVHGSSMLNEQRVEASTDETWSIVLRFLEDALADRN